MLKRIIVLLALSSTPSFADATPDKFIVRVHNNLRESMVVSIKGQPYKVLGNNQGHDFYDVSNLNDIVIRNLITSPDDVIKTEIRVEQNACGSYYHGTDFDLDVDHASSYIVRDGCQIKGDLKFEIHLNPVSYFLSYRTYKYTTLGQGGWTCEMCSPKGQEKLNKLYNDLYNDESCR